MDTLRKGSHSNDVLTLQKALSLPADGIFGPATEKAVKAFQSAHRLNPDGVVGDWTWIALGFDEHQLCADPSVVYSPLGVHVTRCQGRPITYLVIHFTGSSNSTPGRALNMKATFETRAASADYGVDDRDMVQFNPDPRNYYCWAVGGKTYGNHGGKYYGKATNRNCISIEMCSTCEPSTKEAVQHDNHAGWSFTDEVLANGIKLAKILMKKYNIDIDHVIRHYDVTGKLCPGIIGWNDEPLKYLDGSKTGKMNDSSAWLKFKEGLK